MSKIIKTPSFINETKSYATYVKDVTRWQRLIMTKPEDQAFLILHYLDRHPSGIKEKVDAGMTDTDLEDKLGVQKFLSFVKNIYEKDSLADSYQKFTALIELKRSSSVEIKEFISEWHKVMKQAETVGCTLSDKVKAFVLLKAVNISSLEKNLVLTGVNYESDQMMAEMENALKKFLRHRGSE